MPGLTPREQFVFAYGSLAAGAEGAAGARMRGHRRAWTVAMDNRRAIPGYKRYRDPAGFPAVFVAFLDLVARAGGGVDGVCLPVTDAVLDGLDRRERNYDRVDVTAQVDGPVGRVWAYRGSAEGRARAHAGAADGTLVVARAYAEGVRGAFAARGPEALARYDASTDPPPCPVVDLVRVDLPPT